MNDTICGHERNLLRSRLIAAKLRDEGIDVDGNATYRRKLLIERGHDAAKIEASAVKCAIVDAVISDPDELAEIVAELTRKCGLPVLGFNETSSWPFASVGVVDLNEPSASIASGSKLGIRVETVHVPNNETLKNGKLTMQQARSFASKLLDGMAASDIANMIGA